jgi:hypothetical protein
MLVLACFLLIPGCGVVYVDRAVRHTPVTFEQAEYPRRVPVLSVWYRPEDTTGIFLPFRLPEQKGMLSMGTAVRSSYEEALSAYFQVSHGSKSANYYVLVNLHSLELDVSYTPEKPVRGEPVTMRVALSHSISIRDKWQDEMARIVLHRESSIRLLYSDPRRMLETGALTLEKMLAEIERSIVEQLKEPWREGKFNVPF